MVTCQHCRVSSADGSAHLNGCPQLTVLALDDGGRFMQGLLIILGTWGLLAVVWLGGW